jgi:tetratricopeptide (TPR) repeat protein
MKKHRRFLLFAIAATCSFAFGLVSKLHSADSPRFDHKVRDDFFAGFSGNNAAMERGMKACEEILAREPNHAEAMVWHGSGLFFQSIDAFRGGDIQKGIGLSMRGRKEMDAAVALAPENVGVRIPRGAVYLGASHYMPPEQGRPLIELGVADYEAARKVQRDEYAGEHPKGELLFVLADAYSRLGDQEKAAALFTRVQKELPSTEYARRADEWVKNKTLTPEQTRCVGCHVSK